MLQLLQRGSASLRICLSHPPGRNGLTQLLLQALNLGHTRKHGWSDGCKCLSHTLGCTSTAAGSLCHPQAITDSLLQLRELAVYTSFAKSKKESHEKGTTQNDWIMFGCQLWCRMLQLLRAHLMLSNIGLSLAGCDHFLETLFCVGQLVFQVLDLRMRVGNVFGW